MSVTQKDEPKIVLKAEKEKAEKSEDHISPWGTRRDNSVNHRFNEKIYKLFDLKSREISVLDLGCSGGGFVKECIDDGCLAVGLEGSDYSKIHQRAAWPIISNYLFTCDITKNFELFQIINGRESPLLFDVITAWDVVEHIDEEDLSQLTENVRRHLRPGGLWIMSISPNEEIINGKILHQTVQQKSWWLAKFKQLGFIHIEQYVKYFRTQYVRGPKYNAPKSFHLVLVKSNEEGLAPSIPHQSVEEILVDYWLGSWIQRNLKWLICGK